MRKLGIAQKDVIFFQNKEKKITVFPYLHNQGCTSRGPAFRQCGGIWVAKCRE